MDEVLLKQLVRQLRIMNIWITVFSTIFLIALIIAGFLLYQLVEFTRNTQQSIQNLQDGTSEKLDIKTQVCASDLKNLLGKDNTYCEE